MTDFDFDLNGMGDLDSRATDTTPVLSSEPLEQWADEQLADKPSNSADRSSAVFFDIETGPRPEEDLAVMYHEKTLEEFAATCDKRWKPGTVAAKYEEYKVTAWDTFVEKAALSAVTGQVLLIGIVEYDKWFPILTKTEAENLEIFWTRVECWLSDKCPIIGHNSNGFDLPFLVRRSWLLGVHVPREIRQGRYWHPLFRDTMEWWACGAREFTGLNDIAAAFGVGQKTEGVHGRDFHRLWDGTMPVEDWGTPEEQRAKALEYCEQDVRLTAAIAAKMGMV